MTWYHTSCLGDTVDSVAETMAPRCIYDALQAPEHFKKDYPLFAKLLQMPIQRAPPSVWTGNGTEQGAYPFSFEWAIREARTAWSSAQAGIGDGRWVMRILGYQPETVMAYGLAELEHRVWQLSELEVPPYYTCPQCGSLV